MSISITDNPLSILVAETAPLSLAAFTQCHDSPDDYDKAFVTLFKQQQSLVDAVTNEWGLSEGDRAIASVTISNSISHFYTQGLQHSYIDNLVLKASSKLKEIFESSDFNGTVGLVSDLDSPLDLMLEVKLALLPAVINLSQALSYLDSSDHERPYLEHLIETCLKLATDISVNWAPESGIYSPQRLFVGVLPMCCQIYQFSWFKELEQSLDTYPALTDETFWDFFFDLNNVISENHMGHANEETGEWTLLQNQIRHFVMDVYRSSEHPLIPRSLSRKLDSHYAKQIEKIAIQVWESECETMIETVQSMSQEEMEEWMASDEASQAMETARFFSLCALEVQRIKTIEDLPGLLDLDLVEKFARKLMAQFWGATKALAKARL